MNRFSIAAIAAAGVIILSLIGYVAVCLLKRRRRPERFRNKWMSIQRLCASKETWGQAVISADQLLDNALKKKRLKGKSMGEKLVSAQNTLSDNDRVWFAHNLAKKLIAGTGSALRESEAKKALVGIRQALRDLGMLNDK